MTDSFEGAQGRRSLCERASDAVFIAVFLARWVYLAGAAASARFWQGRRRRLALAGVGLALAIGVLWGLPAANSSTSVTFTLTDNPGRWFDTGVDISGTRSLAIVAPGDQVHFSGRSATGHTVTSLIFPTGAAGMPFDSGVGSTVTLQTPGLYVFWCKIHPYMFGAVIVDDPATPELDLGQAISLFNGITVPTASDLALRLVRTFFVATNPANWQVYTAGASATWDPTYPAVSALAFDANGIPVSVANLDAYFQTYFGEPVTLAAAAAPSAPGVGEVWIDTQFELTARKTKPGTATAVNASTWQVRRKVALPQINMNNPHNMWTDRSQSLIYQTQWFDQRLTVFRRDSGILIRDIPIGPSPAHVMTRVDTDQVHVTLNGSGSNASVIELQPGATRPARPIDIGRPHPHAHWMGHDGLTMVTPNAYTADSSVYDFSTDALRVIVPAGAQPIATGMTPDSAKTYVANFLDSTLTVYLTATGSVLTTINLLANYDPISGAITGPAGGLPIQTPVSPNGKYMVTANTLTATLTIVDVASDIVIAMLPCDAGCHGVQFGAKEGGGYYVYVSSKFSNVLTVVDPDPNNDGDASDAAIVGRVVLTGGASDDTITGNAGMGGQGVLPIPIVYNGWVQNLPAAWKAQLTPDQINPIP
jgi:hypothetical protein